MNDDPGSLNRLEDIVMPDAASWWPMAPGWYVLSAVVLAGVIYVSARLIHKHRANAYRRAGLVSLESAVTDAEVSAVMKRVAMVAFGRDEVASLSGEAWCKWLESHGGGPMSDSQQATFLKGIYGEDRSLHSELKGYAASWIRSHAVVQKDHPVEVVA